MYTNISPRCTPLAPDSNVAPKGYVVLNFAFRYGAYTLDAREAYGFTVAIGLTIPPRRALLSGTISAPRLPSYSRALGIIDSRSRRPMNGHLPLGPLLGVFNLSPTFSYFSSSFSFIAFFTLPSANFLQVPSGT